MKIAFYKAEGDWTDKLIRFWTVGNYSHCELVIGDDWYTSSWYDGGVVRRKIHPSTEHWDFIELPSKYIDRTLSLFNQTKGAKYDLLGILLNEFIPLKKQDNKKWYCSEWCAEALGLGVKVSPNALYKVIKNNQELKV